MTSRAARTARGWAITGVSALVAAVMHTAGGGVFPDARAVLLAAVFTGLLCTLLAGGRPGSARGRTIRTALSVALAQVVFHVVYTLSTGSATVAESGGPGAHHHTLVLLPGLPAGAMGPLAHLLHGGPLMAGAHLLAAALTVVLLRSTDAALALVARWAARIAVALLVLLGPLPARGSRRPHPIAAPPLWPTGPALLGALRYRGPPAPA